MIVNVVVLKTGYRTLLIDWQLSWTVGLLPGMFMLVGGGIGFAPEPLFTGNPFMLYGELDATWVKLMSSSLIEATEIFIHPVVNTGATVGGMVLPVGDGDGLLMGCDGIGGDVLELPLTVAGEVGGD